MRLVATVLLTCLAATAAADSDPIAACRAAHATDPAAHIACLEDALRAAGKAQAQVQTSARPAPPAVAPAVAAAAAAPMTAAAADATAGASAPAPTGLGAEQAKARQRSPEAPPEQVAVRIVSATYNAAGLGIFRMADGQVWRETVLSPERHHLDAGREYAARIERGKVGGYRMYVEGVKWMHKVERLQ